MVTDRAFLDLKRKVDKLETDLKALTIGTAYNLKAIDDQFQRTGATIPSMSIGFQDVLITWPKLWPDNQYTVLIGIQAGDNVITNLNYGLKIGTKTAQDCVIRLQALASLGTFGVEVVGVRT